MVRGQSLPWKLFGGVTFSPQRRWETICPVPAAQWHQWEHLLSPELQGSEGQS